MSKGTYAKEFTDLNSTLAAMVGPDGGWATAEAIAERTGWPLDHVMETLWMAWSAGYISLDMQAAPKWERMG